MNINNPTTFSTPDLTLSTSNSSGSAGALRADDTVLVYDTTVPTTIAYGASASAGNTATAARRNHTHGMAASDAVAQASQAETEGETNVSKYVPPDLLRYSPGVAKAWCNVDADGTLNSPSYNLTSAAKNSTGNYTLTWVTSFSSVEYCTLATTSDTEGGCRTGGVGTRAVGTNKLFTSNGDFDATDSAFNIAAYGDQ